MKKTDLDRFDGRLKNASEAKQNKLERFKAAAVDPERLAKNAQRDEAAAARKSARQAKATKLLQEKEARERQQAEIAKREEEQAEVHEAALKTELSETVEQALAQPETREAERKAERDRRYAARRNRKR
ncbi:DUF6481 family protein [Sulfitobacter sp. BSw21498]|uniref:DUF6481 family protein n=1 Tax=Sulfitobacter sp. BSw21498 TaxID=664426 RepID=UPI001110DE42|nr:DUF6481 family protein [Sulfitobacter sp. BSw21498]